APARIICIGVWSGNTRAREARAAMPIRLTNHESATVTIVIAATTATLGAASRARTGPIGPRSIRSKRGLAGAAEVRCEDGGTETSFADAVMEAPPVGFAKSKFIF